MSKRYNQKMELCKQPKSFKTMWAMIQIKKDSEMFYNFQRECNTGNTHLLVLFIYKRSKSIWEHPFACSFYFYFDKFKKQKTTIAPMAPSIFFLENEIKLNFFFNPKS